MANEEKNTERRALKALMELGAKLDEQMDEQMKALLLAYGEGLVAGARSAQR